MWSLLYPIHVLKRTLGSCATSLALICVPVYYIIQPCILSKVGYTSTTQCTSVSYAYFRIMCDGLVLICVLFQPCILSKVGYTSTTSSRTRRDATARQPIRIVPVYYEEDFDQWASLVTTYYDFKQGSFLRRMHECHERCSTHLQTSFKPEDQIQGILRTPLASTLVHYAFNIIDLSTFNIVHPNSVCYRESHQLPFQFPQSRTSHTEHHTTEVKLTISFNIFHTQCLQIYYLATHEISQWRNTDCIHLCSLLALDSQW